MFNTILTNILSFLRNVLAVVFYILYALGLWIIFLAIYIIYNAYACTRARERGANNGTKKD